METLCIIPCGSKKIWDVDLNAGPTAAKDVYVGTFSKKCREYAEKFHPNSWVILSAKYGFLFPDDIIPETYDVTFNDKKTSPISTNALRQQMSKPHLSNVSRVVVLGGKNYVGIARDIFKNVTIEIPLAGCSGIGFMLSRLKTSIDGGMKL